VRVGSGIVHVVERAYDVEAPTILWLKSLVEAAETSFEGQVAVQAYTFDVASSGAFRVNEIASEPAWEDLFRRAHAFAEPEAIRQIYLRGAVRSVYHALAGRREDPGYQQCVRDGIRNITLSLGTDPSGRGCALVFLQRDASRLSRAVRQSLERIAAHLGAARRLRGHRPEERCDAVLWPDGRVLHAEGDARPEESRLALREAARRMDRARSRRARTDPVEALAMWRALVDGRWSLVERFESDGRRLIVARRNDPTTRALRALDERERKTVALLAMGHSLKLCAYELGCAESTISAATRSALAKLGLASRMELVELHGALVTSDEVPKESGVSG
jgi:DNA-binding CsgD family transcriptional regulator